MQERWPSRLIIGEQARVTPGLPNNVREQPATSSRLTGEIPPGEVFDVLDGPRCASGLAWWQVNYKGLVGWTPEGQDQVYWLEPLALSRPAISTANASQLSALTNLQVSSPARIAWSPSGGILAVAHSRGITLYAAADFTAQPDILMQDNVTDVAFGPDDTRLALAAHNNIYGWDTNSTAEPLVLQGHSDIVQTVDWNVNAGLIASGSLDNTVRLWNPNSGLEQTVLQIGSAVNQVTFSSNGLLLAVAASDGTVQVWDVSHRTQRTVLRAHIGAARTVAFSPGSDDLLASGGDDGQVKWWNLSTNQQVSTMDAQAGSVGSIAFSPDGSILASTSNFLSTGSLNRAYVWDVITGDQLAVLQGQTSGVISIAFSPDGAQLATASRDGSIWLWGLTPPAA